MMGQEVESVTRGGQCLHFRTPIAQIARVPDTRRERVGVANHEWTAVSSGFGLALSLSLSNLNEVLAVPGHIDERGLRQVIQRRVRSCMCELFDRPLSAILRNPRSSV